MQTISTQKSFTNKNTESIIMLQPTTSTKIEKPNEKCEPETNSLKNKNTEENQSKGNMSKTDESSNCCVQGCEAFKKDYLCCFDDDSCIFDVCTFTCVGLSRAACCCGPELCLCVI